MNLNSLLRNNIKNLQPYSSARDEYSGEAMVFLDANESPFNQPYNRYPDPLQKKLKERITSLKNVGEGQIFLGNGSDEAIDLLIRAFCEPGEDNIVTIDPTYGMYSVAASINNVGVIKVSLKENFELNTSLLIKSTNERTKLAFICSPNNPTGNAFEKNDLLEFTGAFQGIVVIDEAYTDFAPGKSLLPLLDKFDNLVILQTFSKAWGLAGIRLGMAFAAPEIISILNKIKYPYNLNILTQKKGLELIKDREQVNEWVKIIIKERSKMAKLLNELPFVERVYPSDANFLLVKMHDARGIYQYLTERGIIVRDRSKINLCGESLRITIGSPEENEQLIKALNDNR
jgi:histidinol-phosphate aminotransferase